VLNLDESFCDLRGRLAQESPERRDTLQDMLAMRRDEFQNFDIDHGVITSGKMLVQEFRLVRATTDEEELRGKAIWHEDIHDPGDSSAINVRLSLEGDELKFWYFPNGDEPGEPVVLPRKVP